MFGNAKPQLTEHSIACLECACANPDNTGAKMLLTFADAQTPTGVVAAVYMGMAGGATHMVTLARAAIAHERERCALDGRYGRRGCLDDATESTG